MKKNVKHISQAVSLGLCAALLATTALAATGTPYTGAAADITAPAGQQATLLVDGKVTRFDGSDAVYSDADKAEVVYTDDLDDASSRLSSFTAGGADETDNDYAYHAALFVNENGVVDEKSVTEALGKDAVLTGAVAQTETIHTDAISYTSKVLPEGTSAEDAGQLTSFTIAEYYNIGHVANRFYNNGDNTLVMNLTDNAVWNVTGDCLLSSLTIGDDAKVEAQNGTLEMTVDGTPTELAPGTYEGEIRISYTENEPEEAAASAEESAASEIAAPAATPAEVEAPAETPVETSEAPAETSGMSGGAIAGIVIAILAVAAIIVAVVVKKKKK
ncbi:MAG: hypothetical protein PUA87_03505 [Oscillospiraceae bacterium]|nr:hypothetical protein [Oscillospiraceae bacterium]